MSTNSKRTKALKQLVKFSKDEKLEFEKELLHFTFVSLIQGHMRGMKNKEIARKLGVSDSFVSQLFTGDKLLNLELLVKFQRALGIKFDIKTLAESTIDQGSDGKVVSLESYRMRVNTNLNQQTFSIANNG